ncbi:MAG: hypothetical protein CMN76_21260 [Spirochaetaceae bacterium]|nr:hypothetical protein [Spirochaetaceae bacterium]|tara:strand:- start:4310 stop:5821 length:1512 start_codon:yes stop_codon:yes gene_type:complete
MIRKYGTRLSVIAVAFFSLHCPSGGGGNNALAFLALGGEPPVREAPSMRLTYEGSDYGSGTTLNFGSEITNASTGKTYSITIHNDGDESLQLTGSPAVEVSGTNNSDFTISQPAQNTIPGGGNVTFTITFVPGADGAREAELEIASNDDGTPKYGLSLEGTGSGSAPRMAITEGSTQYEHNSEINMGSVQENDSGAARTFTISNTGSQNLTFTNSPAISKAGTNHTEFSVGQPSNANLTPGDSRDFTVTFQPTVDGSKSATLTLETNDPDHPAYEIDLVGTSTPEPQPMIQIEHNSTDYTSGGSIPTFGTVWPGDVSTSKGVIIRNIGTETLTGLSVSVGGSDSSQFVRTALPGTTIAPGGSITVNVTFEPDTVGAKSANLTIESDDGDDGSASSVSLNLSGTGHSGRDILVEWDQSIEKGVSDTGGGYAVCYSQTSGFDPADVDGSSIFCELVSWPGAGDTPTSKVISVNYHGTWYIKVYAFAGFTPDGGPPSAQQSVAVPQ